MQHEGKKQQEGRGFRKEYKMNRMVIARGVVTVPDVMMKEEKKNYEKREKEKGKEILNARTGLSNHEQCDHTVHGCSGTCDQLRR